ncbi:TPA: sodium:calcium antiporter [Candidatus Micrarchaeota archaeon]|nr:sodium:calcium antiporter [Candidatus Micrarchaeota archaeon]HIH29941.1 sodium:calcium antiporter [Candidatus Micrarchaeota archaeon]
MALSELITLFIFIFVLAKASEVVVDNASKLAKFFKVRMLAVGMLLVAVSTSLPELAVSVASSSAGQGAIAAGNVFGSNIANILLILGTAAFLYGFKVGRETLEDLALVLLFTTVISVYIIFHSYIFGQALGFYEGILLLLIAVWYAFRMLNKKTRHEHEEGKEISRHEGLMAFLFFFGGVIAVIISSSFVVDSSVKLADILGLSKSFIGATLIAMGTSLPELTIDLQAIRKKHYGLALGDAIGSNMANLTLVLGTAAAISPIVVQLQVFIAALLFAVIANMVFLYIATVNRKFERKDGVAMGLLYLLYIIIIFYLQFGDIPLVAG